MPLVDAKKLYAVVRIDSECIEHAIVKEHGEEYYQNLKRRLRQLLDSLGQDISDVGCSDSTFSSQGS